MPATSRQLRLWPVRPEAPWYYPREVTQMTRLTPRAARCLKHAEETAKELGHDYVGTEHLLLGILREPDGIAAQVLDNLGVSQQTEHGIFEIINAEGYRTPSNRATSPSGEHIGWMVRTDDGTIQVVDDNGQPLASRLVRQPPPDIEFDSD